MKLIEFCTATNGVEILSSMGTQNIPVPKCEMLSALSFNLRENHRTVTIYPVCAQREYVRVCQEQQAVLVCNPREHLVSFTCSLLKAVLAALVCWGDHTEAQGRRLPPVSEARSPRPRRWQSRPASREALALSASCGRAPGCWRHRLCLPPPLPGVLPVCLSVSGFLPFKDTVTWDWATQAQW